MAKPGGALEERKDHGGVKLAEGEEKWGKSPADGTSCFSEGRDTAVAKGTKQVLPQSLRAGA